MGCWNHTFWDNDECIAILQVFFEHLGLVESKALIKVTVKTFAPQLGMRPLISKMDEETEIKAQQLLYSLSKETVESIIQKDPEFVSKLREDVTTKCSMRLNYTGLEFNTVWALFRMHFGMPVPVDDLERAAEQFKVRDSPGSGGWNMGSHFGNFVGWTPAEVERQRNKDAKVIREGIIKYKGWMMQTTTGSSDGSASSSANNRLKPMRLPLLGTNASAVMWAGVAGHSLPLPSECLWNLDLDSATGKKHELDPLVNVPHCHTCKKTQSEVEAADDGGYLKACPCHFAMYCGRQCQKRGWKIHRVLHKIRTDGVETARREEKERVTQSLRSNGIDLGSTAHG